MRSHCIQSHIMPALLTFSLQISEDFWDYPNLSINRSVFYSPKTFLKNRKSQIDGDSNRGAARISPNIPVKEVQITLWNRTICALNPFSNCSSFAMPSPSKITSDLRFAIRTTHRNRTKSHDLEHFRPWPTEHQHMRSHGSHHHMQAWCVIWCSAGPM